MDLFNDCDELEYMMIEVDMKQSVFIAIFYFCMPHVLNCKLNSSVQ